MGTFGKPADFGSKADFGPKADLRSTFSNPESPFTKTSKRPSAFQAMVGPKIEDAAKAGVVDSNSNYLLTRVNDLLNARREQAKQRQLQMQQYYAQANAAPKGLLQGLLFPLLDIMSNTSMKGNS